MSLRFTDGRTVLAAILVGITVCILFPSAVAHQHGTIPHEIYVWQRQWDDGVSNALTLASPEAPGFTVLAAEIFWNGDNPRVARVDLNVDAMKATHRPIGFALRIGPYSGLFDRNADAASLLTRLAASLLAEAHDGGWLLSEFQIDFDCAESKLDGYRLWIEWLRETVHPIPLTITALPSWLDRNAFTRLAQATDGFVLQVHSLERPTGPDATSTLCDPIPARHWVEQAARIAVPFRVALPTYGYIQSFDKAGRFLGLSAEGPSRSWSHDTTLRSVHADPVALAQLVHDWEQERPANMLGLIWFRLPVEKDRLNWGWATLAAVMAGRTPDRDVQVRVTYPEHGLAEIILVNAGESDQSPNIRIKIKWNEGELIAADGLRGFSVTETESSSTFLQSEQTPIAPTLAPGERWTVGWLRFKHRTEVMTHVITRQP